jgi:hypothetical protein
LATQGAGHFNGDGETVADAGLVIATTGAVGLGFTGPATEIGFAGPPRGVCFAGAASGVCFLIPPMALWAEAGRWQSPPNAAATMMMAIALLFTSPSPDVSALSVVSVLQQLADTSTILLSGHFPTPTAGRVVSHSHAFRFRFDD